MLALLAAANHDWPVMFLWLVVAFVVDGIDGPLARKYDVKTNAPRFDGALLDMIIDYDLCVHSRIRIVSGASTGWVACVVF